MVYLNMQLNIGEIGAIERFALLLKREVR